MANVLAKMENFDDASANGEFEVNLKVSSRQRQSEVDLNLVWSDKNRRLEEKLIQKGTKDGTGQCGKLKLADLNLEAETASLEFERTNCDDEDVLPLCMAQRFSTRRHNRSQNKNKKNKNKKKHLKWKQKRNKKRNNHKAARRRDGRQLRQMTGDFCNRTEVVDWCLTAVPPVAVAETLAGTLAAVPPAINPPPPPAPPAPPAPPQAPTLEELNPINSFEEYMSTFDKVYEPNDLPGREQIFTQNMQLINVTTLQSHYGEVQINILESQSQLSGGTGDLLHHRQHLL